MIAKESRFTLDSNHITSNDKTFIIASDDLFLLGLLNSKIAWFFLKRACSVLGDPDSGGRLELRSIFMEQLPMPVSTDANCAEREAIAAHVEKRLFVEAEQQSLQGSFARFLLDSTGGGALSTKLKQWPELDSLAFLAELGKRKPPPPAKLRQELSELFALRRESVRALAEQAAALDAEIDRLVYVLYGLTAEEVAVVEYSVGAGK